MPKYIFDLETDGLLDDVTKIHCAVMVDVETGSVTQFSSQYESMEDAFSIDDFISLYRDFDEYHWIGHNAIKFDCAVIEKLYGISIDHSRVTDTMVLGRLIHPDIKRSDYDRNRLWKAYVAATDAGEPWTGDIPREFPGQLIGSHSLKAWGYRMGVHKGEYKGGFEAWNQELHDYMIQDGKVTLELYRRLMAHEPSEASVELEHRIAWLCAKIERNGFPFDVTKAAEFHGRLVDERESLRRELIGLFPNWKERLPDFIPKRPNKTKGYLTGVPVPRWKEHEFNPQSRAHIIDRLRAKYDWKPDPEEYTQKPEVDEVTGEKIPVGQPKMDEEVLARLPYPEAKPLSRMFLINKRIGQLAEGKQAWLKVQKEGIIYAQYNTNGAVTGRATHSRPNISQVPRVSSEFGRECRELFHVPDGWVLIGADQAGLELRCLASDLANFDDGAYGQVVTQGDVHSINQEAAELPTRDNAKTFIYAFLYGAGNEKIGRIVGKGAKAGQALKSKFLAKTPALKKLLDGIRANIREREKDPKNKKGKYIIGLDGRIMPLRSEHAALNTRLQNSGAVICKQWGCDWEQALLDAGLKHGWDGDFAFVSWSHDEYQVAVRNDPKLIEMVRNAAVETGRAAGLPYNFKCPLDVDTKVGANWAETH